MTIFEGSNLYTIEDGDVIGMPTSTMRRYLDVTERFRGDPSRCVHLHHLMAACELREPYNFDALRYALHGIIGSNPALRAFFLRGEQGWIQVIKRSINFLIESHDVRPSGDFENDIVDTLVNINETPFDLTSGGPLFKIFMITIGDRRALVWKIHHVLIDGFSLQILVRSFVERYVNFIAGERAPIQIVEPTDYLRFADNEAVWLGEAEVERRLVWWATHLKEQPQLAVPWHESKRREGVLETIGLSYDDVKIQALKDYAKAIKCHISHVIAGVFVRALVEQFVCDDMLVCFQVLNRKKSNFNAVADITDLLLLRCPQPMENGCREWSMEVRDQVALSQSNIVPYWEIVKYVDGERVFAPMGLSPFLFNFYTLDEVPSVSQLGVVPLATKPLRTHCVIFDILCNVIVRRASDGDVMDVHLRYNSPEVESSKAQAIAHKIQVALAGIMKFQLEPA